jgi:site-specific DNA-methyltransferase (adenine-specific)
MSYKILVGNNLDILPTLPDNSVDSIVTDPPYELGFMGKKWDSTGIAYSVELWSECLRVLKPGGHLLAFSGSRTYHRMTVAIEDAGFEIRDMISWISNKTFPKSLNISKAIDKGTGENKQRQLKFVSWMRSTGLTPTKCDEILKTAKHISQTSSHSIHYFNYGQPQIATAETFDILRAYLPEVPEEIERLVAERTGIEWTAYKNRKVLGKSKGAQSDSTGKFGGWGNDDGTGKSEYKLTASATEDAKKWEGWGTALKPTVEPIVMARKPVEGTVANNVLTYGTGGLNIDVSRIGTEERINQPAGNKQDSYGVYKFSNAEVDAFNGSEETMVQGRWPANVILDEHAAEILDQQSEQASRFFYVAKASKRDRNEGLEGLPLRKVEFGGHGNNEPDGMTQQLIHAPRQNFHPTVKPTALMEYLIKLVTQPGGTVLDPFTGSGSTGKAAVLNGFDFIGIEMTEDYVPIIEGRLKHAEKVFAENETEKLF